MGGAETMVVKLANQMAEAGHSATILSFAADSDPAHLINKNVQVISLAHTPQSGFAKIKSECALLRQIEACITPEKPDCVISFLTDVNVRVLTALRKASIPVIVCERSHPIHHRTSHLTNWLRPLIYKKSAAIVVQTNGVQKHYSKSLRSKMQVIPNALILPDTPPKKAQKTILTVGRLVDVKNFDLLIHAFSHVQANYPDWQLHIIGDGPLKDMLQAQIDSLGLSNTVKLLGQQSNWHSGGEIFAFCSRYEGFPNALAEALAAGFACVSVDFDFGPEDILENGSAGILVTERSPHALGQALADLMQFPEKRENLSKTAFQSARRYDINKVYESWHQLLNKVIKENE